MVIRQTKIMWAIWAIILPFFFTMTGCATMDYNSKNQKTVSHKIEMSSDTKLGKYVKNWQVSHPKESGFMPLVDGTNALAARLYLAQEAQKTLDIQYFLVKPDKAGLLIAKALLEAADRGVRVRILIDDVFTTAPDSSLLQINQHPNIELRIFNPISRSGFKWGNYALNFRQSNRRMHNKIFAADEAFLIAGGRNIADEYYQIETKDLFLDFDVLMVGPIVAPVTASFDEYWNHELAVPMEQVQRRAPKITLDEVRAELAQTSKELEQSIYEPAIHSHMMQDFLKNPNFYLAEGAFVVDSPDKLLARSGNENRQLAEQLAKYIDEADHEVIILSPYFIPGKEGMERIRRLIAEGKHVVVITNSLSSNNHTSAYSAYSKYRKDMIKAGVDLYELKANLKSDDTDNKTKSSMTLHTKALIFDKDTLFAGSVNLDPRSINLNSELGIYMPSQPMSEELLQQLQQLLDHATYQVKLDDKNRLIWVSKDGGKEVVYTTNPQTNFLQRIGATILTLTPEGQL